MAENKKRGGLVLTRRIRERIKIGEDIYVSILSVRGSSARILVEAPRDVPVHREENLAASDALPRVCR